MEWLDMAPTYPAALLVAVVAISLGWLVFVPRRSSVLEVSGARPARPPPPFTRP